MAIKAANDDVSATHQPSSQHTNSKPQRSVPAHQQSLSPHKAGDCYRMMLGRTSAVAAKKMGLSFAAARPSNMIVSTTAAFPHVVSSLSGSGTTTSCSTILAATTQLPQCRWHWQIHLTKKFDKESGKFKYEEWTQSRALNVTKAAVKEPTLVDGTSLLGRDLAHTEHIKPTRIKKRRKEQVQYSRKMKRTEDLLNYIQFINDKKMNK